MAVLNLARQTQPEFCYSHILRCIGQNLTTLDLRAFELQCEGDRYRVHGWHKGTSLSVSIDREYSMADIEELEAEGRRQRKAGASRRNLLSLAHILRTAGNYVDLLGQKLIRVEWQYQSEKVQCLTIQYQSPDETEGALDEVCIHIYKEKKKMRPLSIRAASLRA